MAVSAVMGALSAGATALSGGALMGGFLLGAGALGTVMTHFLVSTAMGAALNALTPKPTISNRGSRGYSLNGESGSAVDHQIRSDHHRSLVHLLDFLLSLLLDPGAVGSPSAATPRFARGRACAVPSRFSGTVCCRNTNSSRTSYGRACTCPSSRSRSRMQCTS